MSDPGYVVVGGGIAGVVASILIKQKQPEARVTLVEAEDSCGGLLRSYVNEDGQEFDYGTHIISQTGHEALDELLFSDLDFDDWYELPILKPANYVNGQLYLDSQLIYAAALPQEIVQKGTYELLSADPELAQQADNFEDFCRHTYGETLARELFEPLMKKLLGKPMNELHRNAHLLFGYSRIILGNKVMMQRLKNHPDMDRILGFSSFYQGVSPLKNYYPRHGKGIGLWMDGLLGKAQRQGVEIRTGTAVTGMDIGTNRVRALTLSDGSVLHTEELIWTVPLFPLIKMAGLSFEPRYRPTMRRSVLVHFVFDREFLVDNFHIYCNDPAIQAFRVTLYSNIADNPGENGDHRCTVEILCDDDVEISVDAVRHELTTLGVVSKDARMTYSSVYDVANGFPVYTTGLVEEMERQRLCVASGLDNATVLGKASGNGFFMVEVLRDAYKTLTGKQ